jgi:aldose sugar dehydrogenase
MKKSLLFFLITFFWFISLLIAIIWGYDNPEKIEVGKNFYKKKEIPKFEDIKNSSKKIIANSFTVELSQILSLSEKTAFITYNAKGDTFHKEKLKIYTQNGFIIENLNAKKLNLPKSFTLQRNGGVKTIFTYNNKEFALISSSKKDCFYASIILLESGKEVFKTQCLPDQKKNTDFNGLGSSNIHHKNNIYISLGAPEQSSKKISALAQKPNSFFGKVLKIKKENIDKLIANKENNLIIEIFSLGHRNPQGLTKINNSIFSVEHGPLGGDELNKIFENKNYGWPLVSYGTKYLYDQQGSSYEINHKSNNFEEPLFALVPSVGISALNTCTTGLKNFYKKPCLMALSLSGNNLRPGKSIIIYLLNNKMDKINSIEKIYLGDELRFRHFVTNERNELYEDKNGSIYIAADKKGIYQIDFINFR